MTNQQLNALLVRILKKVAANDVTKNFGINLDQRIVKSGIKALVEELCQRIADREFYRLWLTILNGHGVKVDLFGDGKNPNGSGHGP